MNGYPLPGDSLLFATGAIIANPASELNIFLMGLLLILAAIVGDLANYHVGKFIGPKADTDGFSPIIDNFLKSFL